MNPLGPIFVVGTAWQYGHLGRDATHDGYVGLGPHPDGALRQPQDIDTFMKIRAELFPKLFKEPL